MTTCFYGACTRLAEVRRGEYLHRCQRRGCARPFCFVHAGKELCRRCDPWQPRGWTLQSAFGVSEHEITIERRESVEGEWAKPARPPGEPEPKPPEAAMIRAGSLVCHHSCDEPAFVVEAVASWRDETVAGRDTGQVRETGVLLPPEDKRWVGRDWCPDGAGWTPASGYWSADLILSLLDERERCKATYIVERAVTYDYDRTSSACKRQANKLLEAMAERGLAGGSKRKGWVRLAVGQTEPALRLVEEG